MEVIIVFVHFSLTEPRFALLVFFCVAGFEVVKVLKGLSIVHVKTTSVIRFLRILPIYIFFFYIFCRAGCTSDPMEFT